jgi:predicted HAD superfamily hydrolase
MTKSFDVFDTLIARQCVEPRRVLAILESRAGLPGLAATRLAADRSLGGRGRPWSLHDIWNEVGRVLNLDSATNDRLCELEIQIEHEEVIPITENLALVQDGDLLVSDTYLPAEIVQSLLRKAGLEKTVTIVVSNDGKFQGWIWPKLLEKCAIHEHFGDNPHSDGKTPTQAGIKAIIYTGAKRTKIEHFLAEHGWEPLGNLIREVRLANLYSDNYNSRLTTIRFPVATTIIWRQRQLDFPAQPMA